MMKKNELFLAKICHNLMQKHKVPKKMAQKNFDVIMQKYAEPTRHYHNQEHLINLFQTVLLYENRLEQADAVFLAVFYHDVIYNALQKNNEQKSAKMALTHLADMNFSAAIKHEVFALIVATEKHEATQNTNNFHFFLDADLAILGQKSNIYRAYCEAIRKEYRLVPDVIYRAGRRKVLQHFLQKPRLYFTQEIADTLEKTARLNMFEELESLR